MSTSAQYAASPKIGSASISTGDASRTAPTQQQTVVSAGANGSRIDRITYEAAGTTTASQLRLWLYDGATYKFWRELAIAAATPSSTTQSSSGGVSTAVNPDIMPLILPTGYSLRATLADTQVTQAAQIDSLVASGTINGVAALGNSKFTVTAANATTVAAGATQAGAAFLALAATPLAPAQPSVVTLTSTGNISAVNFTIRGTDATGAVVTEVLAGPNNNTVYSTKVYASVTSIFCSAAVATATSAGIASSVTMPVTPTPFTISSSANISGVTFTVRGTDASGATITESIVGGVAGAVVTSVNTYKSINYLSSSGSAATTVVGTPAVLTQVNVSAFGGDM